jgi:polar amino acid transport system substrate-binding protein
MPTWAWSKARFGTAAQVVAIAAVVALTLAGCGGDDDSGGGGASEPAATVAADQALAAKVPAAVKSDGTIKIGTDSTYAPNEFLDSDGKTVIGFEVDLFDAVAAKLGLKTEWVSSKFADILPGVTSGKYEAGVSSFSINDERKQVVNMVSYYSSGTQWTAKKGNPAQVSPDDACGKKVAVQTGTVQESDDLPARQKDCTGAGKPEISVDSYQSQADATSAVVTGKDDALLADTSVIGYAVKQTNGQLEAIGDIYDAAPYGYVVPKDQADFAQALADAVKALITDGTYNTILTKWGVEKGAIDAPAVNP